MYNVVIHPAGYEDLRSAVNTVFDVFPLAIAGKSVMIKPNALRASTPDEGIATHPSVLRAVIEKVEQMGPKSIVVGDNPGLFNYGANEETFTQTGLMAAAGAYFRNIGDESRKVDFASDLMPSVSVSSAILDADIVISLPKFKTHGLTVMTGAIKNSYGYLPGAQKAKLHRLAGNPQKFHEVIVDVFRLRPPDLFIVDAVVGMEGNGPASPDLRDVGYIMASDNAVALDACIARMMGLEPGKLRFLQKAKKDGLGDYDSEQIHIIGELKQIPDFKVPPLGGEVLMNNETVQGLLHSRTTLRPSADPELCTGCETCVEQCPVSALSMNETIPVVDEDLCIACFCCQEICPEKAITLKE